MLNDLARDIHQNAVDHGWWEERRSFGEIIALCHSELSEALEEYRNGKSNLYYKCTSGKNISSGSMCGEECDICTGGKPEGIAIELADCIIRILDTCYDMGIDIEEAIRIKHEYNKTRPWRHGGKAI